MQAERYHGLIAVWKESGYTSHDVVAKLRGILHQKKIGHTGTLDPQAEGVLAVGLGLGTKTFELLENQSKSYEAEVTFGVKTDTEDIWGKVLGRSEFTGTSQQIENAILSFQGTYEQIPPMYSAKKVDGKKLYQLARQGKTVQRKPVPVTIHRIRVLSVSGCRARFAVSCSAGTYIRTLCVDIGKKLGCDACMSSLTRTFAGGFDREQALTLDQIRDLADRNCLEERLIPIDRALEHFPAVQAEKGWEKQLKNGNSIPESAILQDDSGKERVRLYLADGTFIGIYHRDRENRLVKPVKIFYRGMEA